MYTYDLLTPCLIIIDIDWIVNTLFDHGQHNGTLLSAHKLPSIVMCFRNNYVAILV